MGGDHKGLPVAGYTDQSDDAVAIVNANKEVEERLLRMLDSAARGGACDSRWLDIAREHFEQGFMAMNRSVFQPKRITLPEDKQ